MIAIPPLRVVLLREGDQWNAQALEHDFATQGWTIRAALADLVATLISHAALALQRPGYAVTDVPPAPVYYQRYFDEGFGIAVPLDVPPKVEVDGVVHLCQPISLTVHLHDRPHADWRFGARRQASTSAARTAG